MPQPNWLVVAGMAKETTWGTPVSPPTMSFTTDKPAFTEKQNPVYDRSLRGIRAALQNLAMADAHTEVDLPNMSWYGDDSGNFLMAMLGVDTITGTARTGTIGAVAAGATSVTYTVGTGGASTTGDIFKIDAGLPTQEIVIPTSIAANVWTVPATGPNSFKFAHAGGATATTLFTHTMTMLNSAQPPSYTLAKFDNLVATARQIAGVYFEEVTIKFVNPGAMTVDAKGRGKLGTNITKPAFPAWSQELFNVPWQSTFTIAGVANARVVDFTVSLKAPVDLIYGMANTQSPTGAIGDQLTVTGSGTVVPDDYTEFNYYLNNTQPSLALTVDNGSTRSLFQMSKVGFIDPMSLDHSGNYTKLPFTFEAVSNATDAGTGNAPLKAVLMSGRSTAY